MTPIIHVLWPYRVGVLMVEVSGIEPESCRLWWSSQRVTVWN